MISILPHGGTLVQRIVQGEERERLLQDQYEFILFAY